MNAPLSGLPPERMLLAYVRSLQRRAFVLYLVRALCAALGGTCLLLALVGSLSGPVVTPLFSRIALGLLAAFAAVVVVMSMWPLVRLRGIGGSSLVSAHEPVLGSRVRSALELHANGGGFASADLIAAHARGVRDAVAALPPASVVPLRAGLRHPAAAAGAIAGLLGVALLLGSDTARSGALAMLEPAEMRPDGVRVAPVIAGLSVRLVYPSYLGKHTERLLNPAELAAPRGTTVELVVTPRLPARQGTLRLGTAQVRMSAAPDGKLFARFVVRESSELALRIHSEHVWYEDSRPRRVRAIPDARPTVKLDAPLGGTTVEAHEPVVLRFDAEDDHGLSVLELVIRSQEGDEQRRRLWSSPSEDKPQRKLSDELTLVPSEVGAQPGDVLMAWLEARDGDVVSGPNVGISKPVSIEVATDAQQLSLKLPLLREVLDGALDGLADRLESPVPEQPPLAAQRMRELHDSAQRWLSDLQTLIGSARKQGGDSGLDLDQLQGVLERTRRELGREAALYRGPARSQKSWQDADAKLVDAHERDVLLLSDMLAQALVDEARALTQELSDLKRHIRELLQRLKQENSPEAQRALLSEVAKAQRRLRELAQSLARLSNRVPSEFINREALPQSGAKDTLDELRAAVESGNLDAAERQLEQLDQQIDELAKNIESGGARFREAHYGARDKALAEAQQQLRGLSQEQARLAERTRDVLQRTSERARSQSGNASPGGEMQRAAEQLQRDLSELEASDPGSPERPFLERARERMRDAADAMRTGDLSEARRMSQAASTNLEQAAASLEQDARMFPGHSGETWERARAARGAADRLRKLGEQLDRAMPQLDEHIGDGERRQLRGDVDPQRRAREQAEQLGRKMGQGEQGPLSPQGERELQDAAEAMRRAERALDRGDPQGAALAQDEASERLKQLDERLRERGQKQPRPNRGRREGGDGGGMARPEGPVRIPRADEFNAPVQMRRRLLDAMREAAPAEYEGAVNRYYEELLR